MVKFECTAVQCVNKGIEYNLVGFPKTAQCGGCGTMLEAQTSDLPEAENVGIDFFEVIDK